MDIPRFGFSIPPGTPIGVANEVAAAEAMGYARVGIWDSPALFREPWVTLAAVAQHTHHTALGTWAVSYTHLNCQSQLAKLGVEIHVEGLHFLQSHELPDYRCGVGQVA